MEGNCPLLVYEASQLQPCPYENSSLHGWASLLPSEIHCARRGELSTMIVIQEEETTLWISHYNSERNFHQRMNLIKIRQDSRSNKKPFNYISTVLDLSSS